MSAACQFADILGEEKEKNNKRAMRYALQTIS